MLGHVNRLGCANLSRSKLGFEVCCGVAAAPLAELVDVIQSDSPVKAVDQQPVASSVQPHAHYARSSWNLQPRASFVGAGCYHHIYASCQLRNA